MLNLPSLSADVLPAGFPHPATSAKTGQDGLFAARLKTAAAHQTEGNRSPFAAIRASETLPIDGPLLLPATNEIIPDEMSIATELAESANGSAGATVLTSLFLPQSAEPLKTEAKTETTMRPIVAETVLPELGRESITVRLLDTLTATNTHAPGAEAVPQKSMPAGAEAVRDTADTPSVLTQPFAAMSGDETTAPNDTPQVSLNIAQAKGRVPQTATDQPLPMTSLPTSELPAVNTTLGQVMVPEFSTNQEAADRTVRQVMPASSLTLSSANATLSLPQTATDQPVPLASLATSGLPANKAHPGQVMVPELPTYPEKMERTVDQVIAVAKGAVEGSSSQASGPTTVPTTDTSRLDVTDHSIRSRLPHAFADVSQKTEDDGSSNSTSQNRQPELTAATSQTAKQPFFGEQFMPQSNESILPLHGGAVSFSQHPIHGQQPAVPSSLAPFTLPSGLLVPEGTVVDQLITHFGANNQLENGTVNLRLHPQELGALRLQITLEQENIKAHIVAQTTQAQEMIDRHLPRLRESLAQQGLNLQQVEVTVAAHDTAFGERFQNSSAWHHPRQSPFQAASGSPFAILEADEASHEPQPATTMLRAVA